MRQDTAIPGLEDRPGQMYREAVPAYAHDLVHAQVSQLLQYQRIAVRGRLFVLVGLYAAHVPMGDEDKSIFQIAGELAKSTNYGSDLQLLQGYAFNSRLR